MSNHGGSITCNILETYAELRARRPGLHEFLSSVATKYEMHVYTMGTRAYAEEVCAAIDPDGKFFGGRLLSRDESGSTYSHPSFHVILKSECSLFSLYRYDAEELGKAIPRRHVHGCDHRRPCRRMGLERQPRQGHPM